MTSTMNLDPSAPAPRRWRRWAAVLAVLLALSFLAAAGYGGWRVWKLRAETQDMVAAQETLLRRLSHELADAEGELESLREHQDDLGDSLRKAQDDVAKLQSRADGADQALARLEADLNGGRRRAQLYGVEQLLLLANERAQLAHDAHGAAAALALADQRLASLSEPRLYDVRKALADERAALLAVPQADRDSAALALNGLIDRASTLPLRSRPGLPPAPVTTATPTSASGGFWARGWASFKQLLRAVFVVRRTDRPLAPLLPPEQEALVEQLYLLKLESARAALLEGDTAAFRGALDSAARWLDDYYRVEDPGVAAARSEIERLRGLDLSPPLPDLSRSLDLLRAYLDAPAH
ncbi:MAG: uroporphyrinogen-III C-methyltransferase [Nevskia sp.]|nr:uroporphyrinogen-III C-methyltransferase [Nevskia sp.]